MFSNKVHGLFLPLRFFFRRLTRSASPKTRMRRKSTSSYSILMDDLASRRADGAAAKQWRRVGSDATLSDSYTGRAHKSTGKQALSGCTRSRSPDDHSSSSTCICAASAEVGATSTLRLASPSMARISESRRDLRKSGSTSYELRMPKW